MPMNTNLISSRICEVNSLVQLVQFFRYADGWAVLDNCSCPETMTSEVVESNWDNGNIYSVLLQCAKCYHRQSRLGHEKSKKKKNTLMEKS